MKSRYAIMVVNDIFEGENLLIAKWSGGQYSERFSETITGDMVYKWLEKHGMDADSCIINVVEEDWKGNPRISRY